jgi:hypothetical protein
MHVLTVYSYQVCVCFERGYQDAIFASFIIFVDSVAVDGYLGMWRGACHPLHIADSATFHCNGGT